MSERLKHEGRLAEKEREAKRLTLKIKGLVDSMRDALDPFEPALGLDLELVAEQAIEIRSAQIDLVAIDAEIKAILKVLGR